MEKYDDISDEELRMYQILVNEDIMDKAVRDKIISLNVGFVSPAALNDNFSSGNSEDEDILNMDGSNMVSYILSKLQNQMKNLEYILTESRRNGINTQEYYDEAMAELKIRRKEVKKLRAESKYLESLDDSMDIETCNFCPTFLTYIKNAYTKKEEVSNSTTNAISEDTCSSESKEKEMTRKNEILKKYLLGNSVGYSSSSTDDSSEDLCISIPKKKKMTKNKVKENLLSKYEVYSSSDDMSEDACSIRPKQKKMTATNTVMRKYRHRKGKVYCTSDSISEATCSSKPKKKMTATSKVVKEYQHKKCKSQNCTDDISEDTCSSQCKKNEREKVVKE